MENYLRINNLVYAFDFNKLMEFVIQVPPNERNSTQTISQMYGLQNENDELSLLNKQISETKDANNITIGYRYELVKQMIDMLIMPISDANGNLILTNELMEFHIGQKLALNTLLAMGIIYEIESEENE